MSIRIAVDHRTEDHYDRFVELPPQVARLRPAPHNHTQGRIPVPAPEPDSPFTLELRQSFR